MDLSGVSSATKNFSSKIFVKQMKTTQASGSCWVVATWSNMSNIVIEEQPV